MIDASITISIAEQDREILRDLVSALSTFAQARPDVRTAADVIEERTAKEEAAKAAKAAQDAQAAAEKAAGVPAGFRPAPAEAVPFKEEPKAEPQPETEFTLDEVRQLVMHLSRKGNDVKAQVKKILNKYADSVPHLKKADYGPFMEELIEYGKSLPVEG